MVEKWPAQQVKQNRASGTPEVPFRCACLHYRWSWSTGRSNTHDSTEQTNITSLKKTNSMLRILTQVPQTLPVRTVDPDIHWTLQLSFCGFHQMQPLILCGGPSQPNITVLWEYLNIRKKDQLT